jgi:hypothetical protein
MMDPLNYASVDLSMDVFDGALIAARGIKKPMKKYVVKIGKHFFRYIFVTM